MDERGVRLLTVALMGGVALTAVSAKAQPRCEAPRVMVVVDRSSSMSRQRSGVLESGHSKWEAARNAVAELSGRFAETVEFGLTIYPAADGANTCAPGGVVVDVGPNTADTIMAAFPSADPPYAGNWTATAQTLESLTAHAPLGDETRTRHVVLITDGEQCCYGAGSTGCIAEQRFWPVDQVLRLREMGIVTHVVGFGQSVDPLVLNRSAVAGGTAFPGCDIESSDARNPNNCYYQADSLAELSAALDGIAREITDEVCDGFDNDCDGDVDDGFDLDTDTYTTCGSDPSRPGTTPVRDRVDCVDSDAAIHPGAAEICNGVDDDCDGAVDPGCDCRIGEERPCGSDEGVCEVGVQRCTAGTWGECEGGVTPAEVEVCDGADDDCDGTSDEGALCEPGSVCSDGACVVVATQDGGCCSVTGASHRSDDAPLALLLVGALATLARLRQRRRAAR